MKNIQPKKRIRLKGFDYSGRFRYFLTFCTKDKAAYFNDAALVSGVADFLRETAEQHKFKIWSFCFMPDHLHVLVEGMHEASDFRKFVSSFKQRSGYWFRYSINKVGQGSTWPGAISPAENQYNDALLKGCPVKAKSSELCNPEGLPYESKSSGLHNPKSRGFTLIEIVITIVLVGILSGFAAMIILQGARGYSDEQSRSDVHYQARFAMDRMAREIRAARLASETGTVVSGAITGNPTNSLIFTDLSGVTISYSLSGTDLMRTTGGMPVLLANGITTLEFQHYDNAGAFTTTAANVWIIELNLVAQQSGEALNLRTRVHPRNF